MASETNEKKEEKKEVDLGQVLWIIFGVLGGVLAILVLAWIGTTVFGTKKKEILSFNPADNSRTTRRELERVGFFHNP